MKLLDILRKLGIFRSGNFSGTYKSGKEIPAELLMDNVFDSKKDLINKEDLKKVKTKIKEVGNNKKGGKIKFILSWIFGIIFFIFGFLSFGSSFISGIFGILTGALIFPKTSNFLTTKIKILEKKKWKIIAIIISFLIFLFSGNSSEEYALEIKTGNDDPQIVMEFQEDLIELVSNYKEAQIRTVVISQIKFGGAELEEAQKYVKETSDKWEDVEKSADKMEKYIEYQEKKEKKTSGWFNFLKSKKVLAEEKEAEKYKFEVDPLEVDMGSKPGEFTGMENNNINEVELQDKGKELVQTKWDMVEMIRAVLPDKSILKAVMQEFGTTAKKSKELVDQYHGGMAEVWKDEAKYSHSRENFFRGVKTASSVGLTIGGGVAFMGELVAVSAGPTVLSGMKLAAETIVLAFAKTDMVLEVMETGVIVATGDEKNAAAITNTRKTTSMIKNIISVKDFIKNPTLADGGNLETIDGLKDVAFEYGKTGVEEAGKVFLFEEGEGKMKVKVGEKFAPMSSDGIVQEYFPKNFEYEYSNWGDDYHRQKIEQTATENNKTKGYRGDSACARGISMDDELYQRILKSNDRHNIAKIECEKELGVKVGFGDPRWLEVMQCACNKDPEGAVARLYCCSDVTMEEIGKSISDSIGAIQEEGKRKSEEIERKRYNGKTQAEAWEELGL